ncbi:MAG TPA: hypothetical protein VGP57_02685 [Actinoplanes sp.]|nr:hypothetical protein [Actinoplanes sp.]
MVGHSMGGSATAATTLADRRVDVGVNMDGSFNPAVPESGLDRPFLMLGAEEQGSPGADDSWTGTWPNPPTGDAGSPWPGPSASRSPTTPRSATRSASRSVRSLEIVAAVLGRHL